ncbi:MAG: hypothetical protein P1P90_00850 [Patescibacteria group bacterium]|nr:hypothetical protein [Patescibacteria group bacterium]
MINTLTKLILPAIFLTLVAAGCNNGQVAVDADAEAAKQKDIQEQLDNFSCFEFCNEKMPFVCPDYDADTCEQDCLSKWPDTIRECMVTAEDCEQISNTEPYCEEKLDKDLMPKPELTELPAGCNGACLQYKKCAGYTEGAGAEDQEYAYESCMQTCVGWSEKTINCVRSKQIHQAADCAVMTACVLKEANKYLQ